jgi:hypothetical protein
LLQRRPVAGQPHRQAVRAAVRGRRAGVLPDEGDAGHRLAVLHGRRERDLADVRGQRVRHHRGQGRIGLHREHASVGADLHARFVAAQQHDLPARGVGSGGRRSEARGDGESEDEQVASHACSGTKGWIAPWRAGCHAAS